MQPCTLVNHYPYLRLVACLHIRNMVYVNLYWSPQFVTSMHMRNKVDIGIDHSFMHMRSEVDLGTGLHSSIPTSSFLFGTNFFAHLYI